MSWTERAGDGGAAPAAVPLPSDVPTDALELQPMFFAQLLHMAFLFRTHK